MNASRYALLLACSSLSVLAQSSEFTALDASAGKALFDKNWVQAPASTSSSDGLGPHYSNRSCAACHPAGGRGIGPQSSTLQINDPVYGLRLHQYSLALIPPEAQISWVPAEPVTESSEVISAVGTAVVTGQSFSSGTAGQPLSREGGLEDESESESGHPLLLRPVIAELAYGPLQSALSIRLAPSLAGLGLLEQVPVSVLLALADPDDVNGDGISGRIAWLEQDATGIQAGRFGWKATSASLKTQTALALSLDIGISNPVYPDPWGDCTQVQSACRTSAKETATSLIARTEASQVILDLLNAYLVSLPAPTSAVSAIRPAPEQITGADLFQRIGCSSCHVPELSSEAGPVVAYTDLLLHDMGQDLDDGLAEGAASSNEWRTAPLWSLPRFGPYMHNGRAGTLDQAITLHGGEADSSRDAYRQLNQAAQASLLAFLLGL